MPVSHIGLTVSQVSHSTSFFLACLQPLGYRYIGQHGHQVGFGVREADFFICQETPGTKAGAAHIAFTAHSRAAVREFYAAALNAGGRPNGVPAVRCEEDGHFNAAVFDLDGNSIEVVFKNGPDMRDDGTVVNHSRVITKSAAGTRTDTSRQATGPATTEAMVRGPSTLFQAPTLPRSYSEPVVPRTNPASKSGDKVNKTLIGTLLGAAAGAAVAYAMVRSEQDSSKKEEEFNAYMDAKNAAKVASGFAQNASVPVPDPHRNIDEQSYRSASPPYAQRQIDEDSYYSAENPSAESAYGQRQIEPAPSYHPPSFTSAPATEVLDRRSHYGAHRSTTSPVFVHARSNMSSASTAKPQNVVYASQAQSGAYSDAPSSLISSYVADNESKSSDQSSRSRARPSHSYDSRHNSYSNHGSGRSRGVESSPSPPPPASEARQNSPSRYTASKHEDFIDDYDIDELTEDDNETVAPGDSISQVGSSHRNRRHQSRQYEDDDDETAVSKQSASKHSRHSYRSQRPHRSPISEASTVRPVDRKDSVTEGSKYKKAMNDKVEYGSGDVPIRGITESMVGVGNKSRDEYGNRDVPTRGNKDTVQYGNGDVPIRGFTPSMVGIGNNTDEYGHRDMPTRGNQDTEYGYDDSSIRDLTPSVVSAANKVRNMISHSMDRR